VQKFFGQTYQNILSLLMHLSKINLKPEDSLILRYSNFFCRPSGIPLNVQYSLSDDKVFFQWDAPDLDKRNGPIIGYHPVLSCSDNSQPQHQNVSFYLVNHSKPFF
jgi:hypothetical protein